MAPISMEELSIRYMELFKTSLDLIHTYGTHVNEVVGAGKPGRRAPASVL